MRTVMQNCGGVKAAERENDYSKRLEGIDKEHSVGISVWASSKASLITVPTFSTMDGMVLFSIFDSAFTQSAAMGIMMSYGVSLVLNLLPIIMSKLAHQVIYRTKRFALPMLLVCLIGFFMIWGATFALRFAYSDIYATSSQSMQLENTVMNDTTIETEATENGKNKSIAVVILLGISPLVTSIIGFALEFIGNDEVKNRYEYYERRDIEYDEAISDLQAAVGTMDSDMERDLRLDEEAKNAAIEEIIARTNTLKALARHYLARKLADPGATSKLCAEMRAGSADAELI